MSYSSRFSPAFGPGTSASNDLSQSSSESSRKRRFFTSFENEGPRINSSAEPIRRPASNKGTTSTLRFPNHLSSLSDEPTRDGESASLKLHTDTAWTNPHKLNIGLRQQHLNAVIAVLHRSILDQEFKRAERAWAALLRAEINGQSFDLRTGSRWGVGAEVLLRSDDWNWQSGQQTRRPEKSRLDMHSAAKTRSYLERLILQHPYRKAVPSAIGPTDFYLAMFSLWIRSIADCSALEEEDGSSISPVRSPAAEIQSEWLIHFKVRPKVMKLLSYWQTSFLSGWTTYYRPLYSQMRLVSGV